MQDRIGGAARRDRGIGSEGIRIVAPCGQNGGTEHLVLMGIHRRGTQIADLIKEEIEKYPNADVMFVQEEHKNMGPWHYVKDRFKTVFRKMGQNDRDVK